MADHVPTQINWFGDSLDDTLTRYRKLERPIDGFLVDHVVVVMTVGIIMLGLGLSPYLRFDLAALFLMGYLVMSILVYMHMLATNVFKLSYIGLGETKLRVDANLANTFVFFFGNSSVNLPLITHSVYNFVVAIITVLLFLIFLITVLS